MNLNNSETDQDLQNEALEIFDPIRNFDSVSTFTDPSTIDSYVIADRIRFMRQQELMNPIQSHSQPVNPIDAANNHQLNLTLNLFSNNGTDLTSSIRNSPLGDSLRDTILNPTENKANPVEERILNQPRPMKKHTTTKIECKKKKVWIILSVISVIVILIGTGIGIYIIVQNQQNNNPTEEPTTFYTTNPTTSDLNDISITTTESATTSSTTTESTTLIAPISIITREEWYADPPGPLIKYLSPPLRRIMISHTVTAECSSIDSCSEQMRFLQAYGKSAKGDYLNDIYCNFIIGGDGLIFEGRGWTVRGEHTIEGGVSHNDAVCVGFIGDFTDNPPKQSNIDALFKLLDHGVETSMLTTNYVINAQRDFHSSKSPGEAFYNIIQTWSRYSKRA